MVENKLCIYDGEVLGITLLVADRRTLGSDEGSVQLLAGGYCEGVIDGNLEYGSEDLEESALRYSVGEEGGSEIVFLDEMFEGNEYGNF